MVRSLMKSHFQVGVTSRKRVTELLGTSEYEIDVVSGMKCSGYDLGWCSGLGWDTDTLFVCFDENSLLTKAGTHQH